MNPTLRKAKIADVKSLHVTLLAGAKEGVLLPRSLSQLYSHCRDFVVLELPEKGIIGFCALSLVWDDLAEIRSLYVEAAYRKYGYGRMLVEACAQEARDLGINRLFTLTYQIEFFRRIQFQEVGKDVLPQKIWADCLQCPKFPDCDETAMQRIL